MSSKVKKGKKMSAICFNNVLKTKPKEQLENAATKAKDELAKAQKVLDEYKNKDLSDEKRQLNDKLARLDELNLYVGRVDKNSPNDATLARLEARYGKEYQEIVDIVREKIDKENADEVLDISFAPKRSDESALSEKAQNLGIMSAENLEKGEKMLIDDFKNLILDENLRVDYEKIKTNAKPNIMPSAQFKNYDEFRTLFENVKGKFGYIQTPYKRVKVKMFKAYRHFKENTNNINRDNIKGGFFSTLQDPLFIVRGERAGQNEPSVYFFKPFLSRDSKGRDFVMGIFSIAVDYDGNLNFKTYYHDKRGNRLKSVIDDILKGKGEIVYVKSPNG